MIVKKCRIAYEAERERLLNTMDESEVDVTETGEDNEDNLHDDDDDYEEEEDVSDEEGNYISSPPSSPSKKNGSRRVSGSEPFAVAVPLGDSSLSSTTQPLVRTVTMYFPASGRSSIVSEEVQPLMECPSELKTNLLKDANQSRRSIGGGGAGGGGGGVSIGKNFTTNASGGGGGSIYGRSIFQSPNSYNRLVAEANHRDFAPCPCICFQCCVGDQQRARTYVRVYENRLETNYPYAPWCCFTPEYCIVDHVMTYYFDKGPSQTYCGRVTASLDCFAPCCGPPVVFLKVPRCCCACIDCRPCCGETLYAAPCTCCNLRVYCCCGKPCYEDCACPIALPLQDGTEFIQQYQGAVEEYEKTRASHLQRKVVFRRSADRACDCDFSHPVSTIPFSICVNQMDGKLMSYPGSIPPALTMDRS